MEQYYQQLFEHMHIEENKKENKNNFSFILIQNYEIIISIQ